MEGRNARPHYEKGIRNSGSTANRLPIIASKKIRPEFARRPCVTGGLLLLLLLNFENRVSRGLCGSNIVQRLLRALDHDSRRLIFHRGQFLPLCTSELVHSVQWPFAGFCDRTRLIELKLG